VAGLLLDTNVVSELRKRQRADQGVMEWIHQQPDDELFLSVATFGEIRMGIERLRSRDPQQAAGLEAWAEAMESRFQSRMFDVTLKIFKLWGLLQAIRPISPIDCLLAATALHHDLTLVTRNLEDFKGLGLRVFNPFTGKSS
jgi:toxin FitB